MNESTTDWTLVSLSPLPSTWVLAAIGLVLVSAIVVVLSYRGARRPWTLAAPRLLGAVLVLGFLVEPAVQLRVVRKIKNRLAVVLDRSRSMTLSTDSGLSRYDVALAAIEGAGDDLKQLADSHVVDWFDLEGPLATSALKEPPKAESSDLLTALERAREAGGGKPLAGLVLLSDGADTGALEGAQRGELSAEAKERLARLGVPVNTIFTGGEAGFRDISVAEVAADEFAFVHNTFEVEITLETAGFDGVTVPVTLEREGEVVASQSVALAKDGPTRLTLKAKPDRIGEYVYTVSTPVLAGEAVGSNNQRAFVLSVIRDKIRVLQVAGRPSWDERFLRQHLKENPNVDLISFFILRTPTDLPGAPENELSLIPFPVEKLFTTELRSFDVVIFQDFDYRPYKMAQYLPNIRNAVRDAGLGFVMVGGEQSFSGGGYAGTEIEDILPLRPDMGSIVQGVVTPTLTEAGRSHPVTDLSRGAGRNEQIWTSLGAWTALNKTGGLAQNATALVVEPRLGGGGPSPLIAVMDAGQGRTMAIASDSMWRWRFGQNRGGQAERSYHRFWSNALRWLVRDPEHSRVRVSPDRRRFDVGEPVDVTITVLGQDYQPVPSAALRVTLEKTGAGAGAAPLQLHDVTTGEGGVGRQRFTSLDPGAYRVRAQASASGKQLGEGTGIFVVEARSMELIRGAPRPDLLAALADHTSGRERQAQDDPFSSLATVDPDVVEVDRRRNVELWDNAWAMIAGIALLALDWAMRRRRGYL